MPLHQGTEPMLSTSMKPDAEELADSTVWIPNKIISEKHRKKGEAIIEKNLRTLLSSLRHSN